MFIRLKNDNRIINVLNYDYFRKGGIESDEYTIEFYQEGVVAITLHYNTEHDRDRVYYTILNKLEENNKIIDV